MKSIQHIILLVFIFTFADNTVASELVIYPSVEDNPAYSSVTKLASQQPDATISYGEDPNQYGLLWTSDKTKHNDTLVVLIHGGCWLTAFDIQHTLPMATAVHQAGFNVWSLEYRRTGESGGGWPTTYQDIMAGIKAINSFDKTETKFKKIIIAGHSAGGHLALLAGRDAAKLFPQDFDVHVIGLAAISDIATYAKGDNGCQKAGVQFMAGTSDELPEKYRLANPAAHEIKVPISLMHGAVDPIVSIDQSNNFKQADIEKFAVDKAGHFDWVHPGSSAFNLFVSRLNELKDRTDKVN